MRLNCPLCYPEVEGSLVILPKTHPEYEMSQFTNDGTKKWYLCNECNCVFCKDKITSVWQYSADTYTRLVGEGSIKDKLET